VASNTEYLDRVKLTLEYLHKCSAHYLRTQRVHETSKGQTVWLGEVAVFSLIGHPEAKRCYAWSQREAPNDQGERFVTVLEISPVNSAATAVQASILNDLKKQKE